MPPYRPLYGETANGSLNSKRVMPPYRPLYGETANGSLNCKRVPKGVQTKNEGVPDPPPRTPPPFPGNPQRGEGLPEPTSAFCHSKVCIEIDTLGPATEFQLLSLLALRRAPNRYGERRTPGASTSGPGYGVIFPCMTRQSFVRDPMPSWERGRSRGSVDIARVVQSGGGPTPVSKHHAKLGF